MRIVISLVFFLLLFVSPLRVFAGTLGAGDQCTQNSDCASNLCQNNDTTGVGIAICIGGPIDTPTPTNVPINPCPSQNGVCTKVDTALGSIDVSGPTGFIANAFGVLLSIAGAVAITIIILSGYRIMTSQGDPEKIKGARESLTSAIIGLLFMIFSVAILKIIGVNILHIPGFQ